MALTVYIGCKFLTWIFVRTSGVSLQRHLGYLWAWPGMDAAAFIEDRSKPASPRPLEWLLAWCNLGIGLTCLSFATRGIATANTYWMGWLGMVGIVFVLHFGAFHLLSCGWRSHGVNARPLMDWPILSVSLNEFWGRRWNTAFRDLTYRFWFRPMSARVGPRVSMMIGFVLSGLIHDVVISVPANGGYGMPTVFFLLQALGVLFERSGFARRLGLMRGWRGWSFAAFWLITPISMLFHRHFIERVIVPFLSSIGQFVERGV